MNKRILFIEPFFSGSHKTWVTDLKSHSQHHITILSLPGKFWKWRMYGSAVTLAESFLSLDDVSFDMIIVTDMLDLTTFLSLVRHKLNPAIPVVTYFHENQIAYPWKEDGEDKKLNRDVNYAFMNYTTALASDYVLFNSAHNMHSFYDGMEDILKKMPDCRHSTIAPLKKKSLVLPIGINLKRLDYVEDHVYKCDEPLILWNHRWEFDKNPEDFFNALFQLKSEGYKFKIAALGEFYKNAPVIFEKAKEKLKDCIVKTGFLSGSEYSDWLNAADILPVTSRHDFFGISVMEAIYCNCYPILPNRLTYPDLFDIKSNPDIFYDSYDEFVNLLRDCITAYSSNNNMSYKHYATPYDWETIIPQYDQLFIDICEKNNYK